MTVSIAEYYFLLVLPEIRVKRWIKKETLYFEQAYSLKMNDVPCLNPQYSWRHNSFILLQE